MLFISLKFPQTFVNLNKKKKLTSLDQLHQQLVAVSC